MILHLRYVVLILFLTLQGCADSPLPDDGQVQLALGATQTLLIEQDFDQWDQYFTADAQLNDSDLALTIMRGTAQALHHSFPDVQLRVREQIPTADKVVTRFVLEGTHEGYFSSLKPTHQRVTFSGISIDNFRDGRISRRFMLLDLYGLSQQLAAAAQAPGS